MTIAISHPVSADQYTQDQFKTTDAWKNAAAFDICLPAMTLSFTRDEAGLYHLEVNCVDHRQVAPQYLPKDIDLQSGTPEAIAIKNRITQLKSTAEVISRQELAAEVDPTIYDVSGIDKRGGKITEALNAIPQDKVEAIVERASDFIFNAKFQEYLTEAAEKGRQRAAERAA